MARSSHAEENGGEKKASAWLPRSLFFIFLAAALFCLWTLWQQLSSLRAARAERQAHLELLMSQKNELEALLGLSPCEAAEKAGILLKTEPDNLGKPEAAPEKESGAAAEKPAAAKDGAANPDKIESACVFLVSLAGPDKLSTGSGFFVAPGYVATNRHVLGATPAKVLVTSRALGRPVPGTVVAVGNSKDEDFALVAVDIPEGARVAPLRFASGLKKTQKVGAWGYPNIIGKNDPAYNSLLTGENLSAAPELSYSEGVVSAILDRSPEIIVHTAPISPGNSGGPLLDNNGDLVGINTMITLDEDSYRQASLALSASDLSAFLQKHGVSINKSK